MSEITYDDKVDLQVATNIANINKVTASDMNEIKNVVNGNADEVGDITSLTTTDKTNVVNAVNELNTPEKWVSVGTEAPTDGRKVWFANSVNLIPNNWLSGSISGTTGEPVNYGSRIYTTNKIKVEPNTQYTISNFNTSSYNIINLVDGYTSNGTYIGRIGSVVNGTTITTQSNCEYINITLSDTSDILAFSTYQTYLNNGTLKPQLQEGTILGDYEPYVEDGIYVDDEQWYSKPKVLYENSSGTGSNFTLSESIANYSFIEVEYQLDNYTIFKGSSKLIKNSNTSAIGSLSFVYGNGSNGLFFFGARISMTRNEATIDRNIGLNVATTGTTTQGNTIQVTKVLGYK